ncbi:hypothetical protein C8F04DRAFT_1314937 [Mycena alexandri]|uniref:Citrate transporter-like domain-containing protein n=1 Tax=Mycena alexandri TaxID=1745969 RepID=A0AAD6WQD3_9AGAR|nr:hypothetical protein C8F04DRAFT_1314937 [Mycena alexandri]
MENDETLVHRGSLVESACFLLRRTYYRPNVLPPSLSIIGSLTPSLFLILHRIKTNMLLQVHPRNENTIVTVQQPVKPMCVPSTRHKGTVRGRGAGTSMPLSPVAARARTSPRTRRLKAPRSGRGMSRCLHHLLLIGDFTISSALSKMNIDRVLITRVLSPAGTRPSTVLLAFMRVSCFASMWISNVAAPTLCFTLIRPILRTLPPKSSFGPCLILAIALAANIGGQSCLLGPIVHRRPPRLLHLPPPYLGPPPLCLLLPRARAERRARHRDPAHPPYTRALHAEVEVQEYVGDMGVIAIVPIAALFATGVLKKFVWMFLAMGGIALGKGVQSSGLPEVLDVLIRDLLEGVMLYNIVLILSPVISMFTSHIIASVLLVPIAKEEECTVPADAPLQ